MEGIDGFRDTETTGAMSADFELELPRGPNAPRLARAALTRACANELDPGELDTARLLTTELVTNAVLHGHGTILLRARVAEALVRVDVIDEGGGFAPVQRERAFDAFGGWGLAIVEAESTRWGMLEGATHVWFELERARTRARCA